MIAAIAIECITIVALFAGIDRVIATESGAEKARLDIQLIARLPLGIAVRIGPQDAFETTADRRNGRRTAGRRRR